MEAALDLFLKAARRGEMTEQCSLGIKKHDDQKNTQPCEQKLKRKNRKRKKAKKEAAKQQYRCEAKEKLTLLSLQNAEKKSLEPVSGHLFPETMPPARIGIQYVLKKTGNAVDKYPYRCELCFVDLYDVFSHVETLKHIRVYMMTHHVELARNLGQKLNSLHHKELTDIIIKAEQTGRRPNINIFAEDRLWMEDIYDSDQNDDYQPKSKMQKLDTDKHTALHKEFAPVMTSYAVPTTSGNPTKGDQNDDHQPKSKIQKSDTDKHTALHKDVASATSSDTVSTTSGNPTKVRAEELMDGNDHGELAAEADPITEDSEPAALTFKSNEDLFKFLANFQITNEFDVQFLEKIVEIFNRALQQYNKEKGEEKESSDDAEQSFCERKQFTTFSSAVASTSQNTDSVTSRPQEPSTPCKDTSNSTVNIHPPFQSGSKPTENRPGTIQSSSVFNKTVPVTSASDTKQDQSPSIISNTPAARFENKNKMDTKKFTKVSPTNCDNKDTTSVLTCSRSLDPTAECNNTNQKKPNLTESKITEDRQLPKNSSSAFSSLDRKTSFTYFSDSKSALPAVKRKTPAVRLGSMQKMDASHPGVDTIRVAIIKPVLKATSPRQQDMDTSHKESSQESMSKSEFGSTSKTSEAPDFSRPSFTPCSRTANKEAVTTSTGSTSSSSTQKESLRMSYKDVIDHTCVSRPSKGQCSIKLLLNAAEQKGIVPVSSRELPTVTCQCCRLPRHICTTPSRKMNDMQQSTQCTKVAATKAVLTGSTSFPSQQPPDTSKSQYITSISKPTEGQSAFMPTFTPPSMVTTTNRQWIKPSGHLCVARSPTYIDNTSAASLEQKDSAFSARQQHLDKLSMKTERHGSLVKSKTVTSSEDQQSLKASFTADGKKSATYSSSEIQLAPFVCTTSLNYKSNTSTALNFEEKDKKGPSELIMEVTKDSSKETVLNEGYKFSSIPMRQDRETKCKDVMNKEFLGNPQTIASLSKPSDGQHVSKFSITSCLTTFMKESITNSSDEVRIAPSVRARLPVYDHTICLGGKDNMGVLDVVADVTQVAAKMPVLKGIDINRVVQILMEWDELKFVKNSSL